MPNLVVSEDVDTLLAKSSKTEVLSYLGISTNATNIATNAQGISDNASDIATTNAEVDTKQDILTFGIANTNAVKIDNTSAAANSGDICKFAGSGIMPYTYANLKYDLGVDLKAPIADPDFTGTVGIAKSGVSGVLDINGDVYIENGKIIGETGSIDFDGDQAQLILGTFKSDAIKVERVDANSTLIFGVDASSATTGKATMLNAEVSNDLTVNGKAFIEEIESDGDILLDAAQEVTISGNCEVTGNIKASGKIESTGSTIEASGCNFTSGTIGQVEFGANTEVDYDLKAPNLVANNIKCIGETTATAQPLKFYSNDHRFGDYDQTPDNLLVIKKIDGYTGARVGINKNPSASNAVALHVVAGKNASTQAEDLGLKVVGGSFFEDFIRVGHYTDETRDDLSNPTNGTIIYNSQHHEFQGYVGGGDGWQKFNMGAVST